jgi:epoxyqueuosine reductase
MRNIAIGLGNAPFSTEIMETLKQTRDQHDEIVQVHIDWAIQEHLAKSSSILSQN